MKNIVIIMICVLIVTICALFFTRKENKEELAKHYRISKPTLQKWVKYFHCEIPLEQWKKQRKLTVYQSSLIKHKLGDDPKMVLNKAQIADLSSASTKTVSSYVIENLEKIGLTKEAWNKCSVFPPAISQRIIDGLIGKPEPTASETLVTAFSLA
jgi:uncharacterized protein YxeA